VPRPGPTAQHSSDAETVRQVVGRLNDVEHLLNQRIVVEETAKGWRSRAQDG